MEIYSVENEKFKRYGRVWKGLEWERIRKEMEYTPLPDDVIYVPSVETMEMLPEAERIRNQVYGGLPIQIGYCNGNNHQLNAVEYHRNSEINLAVTDMILLLGWLPDVTDDFTYDTARIEAFRIPAGTAVELYSTTLHYAPCSAAEGGFKCAVILPKGTNTEIDFPLAGVGEDSLMTAKNKWLIAHKDAQIEGAVNGLTGENITIK